MNLTKTTLINLGFVEIPKQPKTTFKREKDNVILYDFVEPIWVVQLDGVIGAYVNLSCIKTVEELELAISRRKIR